MPILSAFWTDHPESRILILLMIAAWAIALLSFLIPAEIRLLRIRGLGVRAKRRLREVADRPERQAILGGVMEKSVLAAQWQEFVRRWREARGDALQSRAPVRFVETLETQPLAPSGPRTALLPALPGLFLGMGILGTFYGLTQALPHAGESFRAPTALVESAEDSERGLEADDAVVPSTDEARQQIDNQIDQMTSALALAFKTSLWGLLLSLFTSVWVRRLDGLYEREGDKLDALVRSVFEWVGPGELSALTLQKQTEAFDLLRSEFTNLSVELSNVLSEGLDRMHTATAKAAEDARRDQAAALQKIATDLSGVLESGLENIARSSADAASLVTNEQRQALAEIVSEIGNTLREGVGEQVRALVDAVESARKSQAEVSAAIARSLEQIEASSSRHAELLAQINATVDGLNQVADKTIDGAREAEPVVGLLRDAGTALNESAEAARAVQDASNESLTALERTLSESRAIVEEQRRLAESSVGEMQQAIKTMSEGLGDSLIRALGQIDTVLAEAVGRVAGTTVETGEMLERLGEPLGALQDRLESISASMGEMSHALEHLGPSLREEIGRVEDALRQSSDRVGAVAGALGEGLETRLEPTKDAIVQAGGAMDASIGRLVASLDARIEPLEKALEQVSQRLASGELDASMERLASLLEAKMAPLGRAIEQSTEHLTNGGFDAAFQKAIDDGANRIEKAIDALRERGVPERSAGVVAARSLASPSIERVNSVAGGALPAPASPPRASSAPNEGTENVPARDSVTGAKVSEGPSPQAETAEKPGLFGGFFGGRR